MAPIKKRTTARAKIAAKNRPQPVSAPYAEAPSSANSGFDADDDNNTSAFSSFGNTKKDKRTIKHSAFVHKIEKSKTTRKNEKRRANKLNKENLQTRLEGLVDALPDIENAQDDDEVDDGWEAMSEDDLAGGTTSTASVKPASSSSTSQQKDDVLASLASMVNVRKSIKNKNKPENGRDDGRMTMKTLKSRPGAAKRKALLEGREMERFAKNLAQMSQPVAPAAAAAAPSSTSDVNTANPATANRWAALRGFIGQTMEQNPSFGKAS